jgi:hypothetical protein
MRESPHIFVAKSMKLIKEAVPMSIGKEEETNRRENTLSGHTKQSPPLLCYL